MLQSFFSSWDLFYQSYVAGWLISVLLSLLGVLVVARDQIFIGAAVSQASTLGIAVTLWAAALSWGPLAPWLESDVFLSVMALIFPMVAASLTARGGQTGRESHEGITGWVFLGSSSLAILIVAHSPHGLEEIHRVFSSSIIGATMGDIWALGILSVLTVSLLLLFLPEIVLLALDPSMAAAVGMKTKFWSLVASAWLGLAIGLSLRASGMLFTFGCLVLPAMAAKNLCAEVRSMFLISPFIALGLTLAGFFAAHSYDLPPGQLTVALFSLIVMVSWVIPKREDRAP